MRHGLVILLALVAATAAGAGVVRNVSDSKTVSFDWAMPIGDGSEVLVATSSNQFAGNGNPNHAFQVAAFDPTTGTGALVTSFSSGSLVHVRHNLSVSDDGQWLAFISNGDLLPGQNGNRSPEVFVMKRDGTMLTQLTDDSTPNAGSVSRLALAGSGNRIAFASSSNLLGTNPGLNRQVYVVDIDGTNLTQMTNATGGDIQHMWISDDGTRIAFAHNGDLTGGNPEHNHEVFTIAVGDALPRQVTSSTVGESEAANISGDGGTIVFHSTADPPDGGTSIGAREIYAADWTTATVSQVTNAPLGSTSRQPWPTNDGSQVFYGEGPFNGFEIYKINTSGSGKTQLTTLGLDAEHPVVSGDGSRFAFWTDEGLYAAAGDGSNLIELVDRITPDLGTGDITPDGQWLSYSGKADHLGNNPDGSYELFVENLDGTQRIQVTDGTGGPSGNYATIIADGSRVYFESTQDHAGQNAEGKGEIFGMDVDGGNPVQLAECDVLPSTAYSIHTTVADDNSVVVFSSSCDQVPGSNADHTFEIFRVDPDGSNLTQLTFGSVGYVYFPRIDATGNWIVFSGPADLTGGNADGSFEVWRMQTNGTNLEQLTADPVYSSLYPDISDDGSRIVFTSEADLTGQNADHNTEVFLYEPATTTTTQLTHSANVENSFLAISGNGAYVYFHSDSQYLEPDPDRGKLELYRIHIDTATLERAGGFGFNRFGAPWWPVSDFTGDRVLFTSQGESLLTSPDTYWDIYLLDYSAPNPLLPSPGPAPTELNWKPEPGMLRYDVIRGDVANLQHSGGTVDLGPVVCLEDDSGDTTTKGFEDPDDPAPGQAFYYLYRGQMGMLAGGGTYGAGTGDLERVAGAGDCVIAQLTASCGNGVQDFPELCDGADLGGESCVSQGFEAGTLACNVTCDGYDTSMCASCGDTICQAFAGEDCVSCAADCNGQQSGNPGNRYCCGDGDGDTPVPCSDPRCTAGGNTCVE